MNHSVPGAKWYLVPGLLGLAVWLAAGVTPPLFADPASCPLVYLPVRATFPSSYDETPDWAPPQDPRAPVDGDFDTRWASTPGVDNEWMVFDLGKPKAVSKVVIHWERAYAADYDLLVSDDAESWRSVAVRRDQHGGTEELTIPETTARYVKVVGLKRSHPDWGISLWEFEVYGCQASNPEDQPIEAVFPGRQLRGAVHLTMEDPLPSPGPVTPDAFQRGMIFLSFHEHQLATPEADAMLEELTKLHVTHVALVVTWYQDTVDSDRIAPESPQGGRTPVDEALAHAINRMHALGMRVMLKPHIDVQTGEFRAEIAGSEAWFESYRAFIRHYAELAAAYHVELLCVGTELAGTSYVKWEPAWRQVIQEVRAVYPGPLVYGANWDEYQGVPFWDAVDFIGIDAYFPLTETTNPTREELVAAGGQRADEIEGWLKQRGLVRPVVFSEIGYGSADGVNRSPWEIPSQQEDQAEQAECLEAMLTVMTKRDWFRGMYWWNWFAQALESPLGFPLRGKLAEGVLARWYEGME